jgi:hypothetical protein
MQRWVLIGFILAVATTAGAEMPYPPNPRPCNGESTDPPCIDATDFSRYLFLETTDPPTLPNDFGSDNWKLTSEKTGDPAIDGNPQELFGVKGASVDLAWQVTTGRPDVLIAVLDSGIRWAEPQPDLASKFYLNRGELPVPENSTNSRDPHDRNGDGLFNILDYLADDTHPRDSRVSDQNDNGVIDPEDLIFLFSDGVDDDANGYVDDISGWDFFEDDNNALDEVRYGHGTGQSRDSAAEANNGAGEPGTCPNCLLLEVRVGDSFITDVNLFAQGVVFAVDSGAQVIQEALGTLNQSRFGQEAVDYAYRNGAVVIASAADEQSNHHNYPANYNHTVQVNSVRRFDEFDPLRQEPASYLYLNGCTNYGGHIAFSVPSSSCSSEATGRGAGMAGLVVSAALNAIDQGRLTPYPRDDGSPAPFPLSADEVKQILSLTADDINFDARDDVDPPLPQNYDTRFAPIQVPGVQNMARFSSIAGWDQYFGYGRVNANRAVRLVAEGQIPPEAVIESPAWYAIVDPEAAATLPIRGRVAANRAASYGYTLEVAPGIQPAEEDFQVIRSVENLSSAIEGELGVIGLAELRARMPHGTSGPAVTDAGLPDPDRFSVTVRVRVVDDQNRLGEDRRVFALHHDPDLLPGFPREIGADGVSSPVTADLDGDGREEIIFGTSNGEVHAIRADGSALQGWPVRTSALEIHLFSQGYRWLGYRGNERPPRRPPSAAVLGAVAVGDVDGNGTLEVAATDMAGYAYLWNANGSLRAGFPVSTLPQYSNTRRSERELGTPEGLVPDRVNRHDANNRLGRALASGPVLANLDGSADGSLEIIAGSFDRHVYAWHANGEPVLGWPVLLKDPEKVEAVDEDTNEVRLIGGSGAAIGTKIVVPPSVGDLDGDGRLEVVAVVNEEYREPANALFTDPNILLFATFGVINMGNTRVYAIHAEGTARGASPLAHGWNPDAFLPGWPVRTALVTTGLLPLVGTGSNGPPALADVNDDGRLEVGTFSVIGPAYVLNASGQSFLGTHPSGEPVTLATDLLGAASNSNDAPSIPALGAPVLAEFAGRGSGFQLLAPAAGLGKFLDNQLPAQQLPADNHFVAWEVTEADDSAASGDFSPAFPRVVNDLQFFGAPAVADITGDRLPEAIIGTGVYDLHAFDVNGAEPPGWPKFTNGWMVGSPAVGDVDGDGLLEVVAVTREGYLFVWRTTGPECGTVLWRRYHHDEWGTGNYHTNARPPASLSAADITSVEVRTAIEVGFELARTPGDDLFCGASVFYDARFSDSPIDTEEAFAAAEPVEGIAVDRNDERRPGNLSLFDERFRGRTVHFAVIVRDDQNNRSTLLSLGQVTFPDQPPPTATLAPTATATVTPTPPLTPTPTEPPPAPTSTPRSPVPEARSDDDGGCAITAGPAPGSWWLGLPLLALILRRPREPRRSFS